MNANANYSLVELDIDAHPPNAILTRLADMAWSTLKPLFATKEDWWKALNYSKGNFFLYECINTRDEKQGFILYERRKAKDTGHYHYMKADSE